MQEVPGSNPGVDHHFVHLVHNSHELFERRSMSSYTLHGDLKLLLKISAARAEHDVAHIPWLQSLSHTNTVKECAGAKPLRNRLNI